MTEPAELPTLLDISAEIAWPDSDAEAATQARLRAAGLGYGALGRLDELAGWLSAVQGVCPPREPRRPRLVLFRTSRTNRTKPADPTDRAGRDDVATVFADVAGVGVRVVELPPAGGSSAAPTAHVHAGVHAAEIHAAEIHAAEIHAAEIHAAEIHAAGVHTADAPPTEAPTADVPASGVPASSVPAPGVRAPEDATVATSATDRNALSPSAVDAAIRVGARAADDEVDAGADLLVVAASGPAGPTADVIVSIMALVEPVKVVGLATTLSDPDWMAWVTDVRDARLRGLPYRHEVAELLAAVGGAELAALTGFLLRAAARRTPVLLDGVAAAAAALLAREISPNVVRWWQAGAGSTRPAHALALQEFGSVPVLDLRLRVDDGVGGVLAVQLLRAAARAVADLTVAPEMPLLRTRTQKPRPDHRPR